MSEPSQKQFPTINNPASVELECGDTVAVRAAQRSERTAIFQAGNMTEGNLGSVARTNDLAVRWGVVGKNGNNLKDRATGSPIKFRREKTSSLGEIASEQFLNALTDADVEKIVTIVLQGGEVSDDEAPASEGN